MRAITTFLLIGLSGFCFAQPVVFSYDDAGNRTHRAKLTLLSTSATPPPTSENMVEPSFEFQDSDSLDLNSKFYYSIDSLLQVSIMPNPTQGILTILFSKDILNSPFSASLFDSNGRTLVIQELRSNPSIIDLSPFSNGVYFINIMTNGKLNQWKVIKN